MQSQRTEEKTFTLLGLVFSAHLLAFPTRPNLSPISSTWSFLPHRERVKMKLAIGNSDLKAQTSAAPRRVGRRRRII